MKTWRIVCGGLAIAAAALAWPVRGEAHRQGVSRYVYNSDVYPVLRDRCGACHEGGGVAPMSLMTYDEAVPWAESIRLELMAGHMPPWAASTGVGQLRHSEGLSARELDMLLTWATGETPMGDTARASHAVNATRGWRNGTPDSVFMLEPVSLDAGTVDRTSTFTIAPPAADGLSLRAVDILPGNSAIVRSATVSSSTGQILALWQPGDPVTPLPEGTAFQLDAGARLVVTLHYRKTWAYERTRMTDQSAVGLYFTVRGTTPVSTVEVAPGTTRIESSVRLLAVAPGPGLNDGEIRVMVTPPLGRPATLIAFRASARWARRYWFEEPLTLVRGTTLEMSPAAAEGGTAGRLLLDVVPAP